MIVKTLKWFIMKKLNRLQINYEKLLKAEELMTLRGGYDGGYCSCRIDGSTCASSMVHTCYGTGYGSCQQFCAYYCPNHNEEICVG
jgi:hypothetical protein